MYRVRNDWTASCRSSDSFESSSCRLTLSNRYFKAIFNCLVNFNRSSAIVVEGGFGAASESKKCERASGLVGCGKFTVRKNGCSGRCTGAGAAAN